MWTIIQYSAAAYVIIASAGLLGLGSSFGQNCQCVYLTGTKGQFWGRFSISSKDIRYNTTECVLIFITGADQEIVELRFEEITLRKGSELMGRTIISQIYPDTYTQRIYVICGCTAGKFIEFSFSENYNICEGLLTLALLQVILSILTLFRCNCCYRCRRTRRIV